VRIGIELGIDEIGDLAGEAMQLDEAEEGSFNTPAGEFVESPLFLPPVRFGPLRWLHSEVILGMSRLASNAQSWLTTQTMRLA
jgi:hypothetical protein